MALHGIEPLGCGTKLGEHSATVTYGHDGEIHGFRSLVLTDDAGQPAPVHSIASGLDYPGVGPKHGFLHKTGRVHYAAVNDQQALDAFYRLSREEGIIPALESSHAVAYAIEAATRISISSPKPTATATDQPLRFGRGA